MASTIIVNKNELDTSLTSIESSVNSLNECVSTMSSTLTSIPSHSDFDIDSKASMLASSVKNMVLDFQHVVKNSKTYLDVLKQIDEESFDVASDTSELFDDNSDGVVLVDSGSNNNDNNSDSHVSNAVYKWSAGTMAGTTGASTLSYDSSGYDLGSSNYTYSYTSSPSGTDVHTPSNFESSTLTSSDMDVPEGGKYNYEGIEKYLEEKEGVTVKLPEGLGAVHTYMGWQCITSKSSNQYKLITAAGMNFDEEGFGKIGDRYVVAVTETFGEIGDYIDVYQEDGTIIKCVIGDHKSMGDADCTKWGHNNGECVLEFVVDKSTWYKNGSGHHSNPGTSSCHPEWNQNIDKIVNKGNYFQLIKTDAAKFTDTGTTSTLDSVTTTDGTTDSAAIETATTDSVNTTESITDNKTTDENTTVPDIPGEVVTI